MSSDKLLGGVSMNMEPSDRRDNPHILSVLSTITCVVSLVTLLVGIHQVIYLREEVAVLKAKVEHQGLWMENIGETSFPWYPQGPDQADNGLRRAGMSGHHRAKREANTVAFRGCTYAGRDGRDGRDGQPGAAGLPGPTGEPGPQGEPGPPGRDCVCSESCPSGFLKFRERCFYFSNVRVSHDNARVACVARGAHLATIKDVTTQNFLVNHIIATTNDSHWLGLTDRIIEGIFVWEDGTPLTGWSNWRAGMPDNNNGAEHCCELQKDHDYKWNDFYCDNNIHFRYYICEVDQNG